MFDCCYWGDKTYDRGWDYIEELSQQFKFLIITQRMDFEYIEPQLQSAKLIILPYRFMAVRPPLTLVESMGLGKCVITTDLGGNTEIIENDYNGYIRPIGGFHGLIKYLLEREVLIKEVGLRAKETITEMYTTQEYERILNVC
jgi:glycosyltransferase involved in cell wall biosynthesis